jgi:hypothetical protein
MYLNKQKRIGRQKFNELAWFLRYAPNTWMSSKESKKETETAK